MHLSVIIPVFNGAAYLAEAIESVLRQTRQPDEILVIDDGSADESVDIARGYKDRVRLVSQDNRGPASARNLGVAQAQGSVLAFLDADDLWLPEKLEHQLEGLRQSDMAFCMIEKFYSDDCPPEMRSTAVDVSDPKAGYLPTTFVCRSDLFKTVGQFDENLKGGEFIDWVARARACGQTETLLPRLLARRRIHAGNLSRENGMMQEYLQVIRRNLARRNNP